MCHQSRRWPRIRYRATAPYAWPKAANQGITLRSNRGAASCCYGSHCLPKLPPPHVASYTEDRTYANLLGSLDDATKNVWAECLFVDPVADLAVLGCPDGELSYEAAATWHAFIDALPVLRIGKPRNGRGWMLSLDGQWVHIRLEVFSGIFGVSLEIDPTKPGQSGSPILNQAGRVVGCISIGSETTGTTGELSDNRCGPQPILTRNLPGWLLEHDRGEERKTETRTQPGDASKTKRSVTLAR